MESRENSYSPPEGQENPKEREYNEIETNFIKNCFFVARYRTGDCDANYVSDTRLVTRRSGYDQPDTEKPELAKATERMNKSIEYFLREPGDTTRLVLLENTLRISRALVQRNAFEGLFLRWDHGQKYAEIYYTVTDPSAEGGKRFPRLAARIGRSGGVKDSLPDFSIFVLIPAHDEKFNRIANYIKNHPRALRKLMMAAIGKVSFERLSSDRNRVSEMRRLLPYGKFEDYIREGGVEPQLVIQEDYSTKKETFTVPYSKPDLDPIPYDLGDDAKKGFLAEIKSGVLNLGATAEVLSVMLDFVEGDIVGLLSSVATHGSLLEVCQVDLRRALIEYVLKHSLVPALLKPDPDEGRKIALSPRIREILLEESAQEIFRKLFFGGKPAAEIDIGVRGLLKWPEYAKAMGYDTAARMVRAIKPLQELLSNRIEWLDAFWIANIIDIAVNTSNKAGCGDIKQLLDLVDGLDPKIRVQTLEDIKLFMRIGADEFRKRRDYANMYIEAKLKEANDS